MVSHMDDDHVRGIVDFTKELRDADDNGEIAPFSVQDFWFNTFDDIIGNIEVPRLAAVASVADLVGAAPELAGADHDVQAVLASTGQGRTLRGDAEQLAINVNRPFAPLNGGTGGRLVRGDVDETRVELDGLPIIHVLHPNQQRLLEMQKKWDEDLQRALDAGDDSIILATLSDRDTSPFNLASIVCVVEFGGRRILLTGDARDDDILTGLKSAGMLDGDGKAHFDLLKVPHHGSDRNVSTDFFRDITADHYVISGNGEHHNPDRATLVMLSMATRGRDDFTVYLTNRDGKHDLGDVLEEFINDDRDRGRTYGFEFRADDALSITVNLLDEMNH
jgi:hypothetical protein